MVGSVLGFLSLIVSWCVNLNIIHALHWLMYPTNILIIKTGHPYLSILPAGSASSEFGGFGVPFC
jgi:hypothetical protein